MTGRAAAHVSISVGEYVDRLTILELKADRASRADAEDRARTRLEAWARAHPVPVGPEVEELTAALRIVNGLLWNAEDEIRQLLDGNDVTGIAAIAADIVRLNDRRAAIKAKIDRHTGSAWTDVKRYAGEEPERVHDDPIDGAR